MKRGHAVEEDFGAVWINVMIHPFGPRPHHSLICYWPRHFVVLTGPFIERPSSLIFAYTNTHTSFMNQPASKPIFFRVNIYIYIYNRVEWCGAYKTFIEPVFIHQMQVLKMRQSTFFQFTPCFSMDSAMIMRFNILCIFGSSEFDSTRNGAQ